MKKISEVFEGKNSSLRKTYEEAVKGVGLIERVAMNIVHQLDDDSGASVEFRQANNDKRIDFVMGLITSTLSELVGEVEKIVSKKYIHKDNRSHMKDEIYCCIDCHDDNQKNEVVAENLSSLEQLKKKMGL